MKLDFLKKVLPWVGAAAEAVATGGPIGLLTVAAKGIGEIVGTEVKADPSSIAAAVAGATPDQIIQMKELDKDYELKLKQAGFADVEELSRISAGDRADARNREVLLRDWFPKFLGAAVVTFCFTGEFIYFRYGAPANASPELIGRILGTLDSALILVLGYYYGSSAGSAAKTQALTEAVSQKS